MTSLFVTDDSAKCKRECIDEGNHFCPTSTGKLGTCCNSTLGCTNSGDYCSFDSSPDSIALKYWICPRNEDLCGEYGEIAAASNGLEYNLKSNEDFEVGFLNGALCSYKIKFPYRSD